MQSFFAWLEQNNNINVSLSEFTLALDHAISKLEDYYSNQANKIKNFKLDWNLIEKGMGEYPNKINFYNAIKRGSFAKELKDFYNWASNQTRSLAGGLTTRHTSPEARQAFRHLSDYEESLAGRTYDINDLKEWRSQIIEQTQANMQKLVGVIQEAVGRIANWGNSNITINASPLHNQFGVDIAPGEDANILVGSKNAMFSLFTRQDQPMEIDDVIESGDEEEDFFANQIEQRDYYNLVNELRKPGSTSKGRILTLYTARPSKDREFYSKTNYLPANIFLTNNPSHAEGIAMDLGSDGMRDVWKVRIDSKYLTQTLDGPVKYYQVTGDKAPVASISLY